MCHRIWILLSIVIFSIIICSQNLASVVYVKWDSNAQVQDGSSWSKAFHTIWEALSVADSGDEVWVSKGIYFESLILDHNVSLYGGFSGNETTRAERNWKQNQTIIDGLRNTVISIVSGSRNLTVVDGFVITDGDGWWYDMYELIGGAIDCHEASATISNNVITGNFYYVISCQDSSQLYLINNDISNNQGDAITCEYGSNCTIIQSKINNNYSGISCCWWSSCCIYNSFLCNNDGSAISSGRGGNIIALNNIIAHNQGNGIGGGYMTENTIVNNTIVDNSGTGIGLEGQLNVICNNIVAFNNYGIFHTGTSADIDENCTYGNTELDYYDSYGNDNYGNIVADPLFADAENGDYHLTLNSPCINACWYEYFDNDDIDIDGQPRIDEGGLDMGADEYYPSVNKPDLLIKSGNSSYDCNNIYSTDGSKQVKSQYTSSNQSVNYGFRVQNDGTSSDSFIITGTAGGKGWTVKYYDLATNKDVTSQVTGSGWSSGILASGSTNGVYVSVTPDSTVTPGTVKALVISAISQGDTTKKDVGMAVTTAIATYKADLLLKAGDTFYTCNNIYSTDGSNQTKIQNVLANQAVSYGFRVQNDGNTSDTLIITGPAGGSGWTVKYIDLTTYKDITIQITGDGWSSGTLAPGATNGVYAIVMPDCSVTPGTANTLVITAVSQNDTSKKDVCKAVTIAIPTYKPDILIKAGSASYDYNNIYSEDGGNQVKIQNISANQRVSYGFRVQNDGNTDDTFKITGSAGGSGWTVRYCDLTTNKDVTAQVTGDGWISGSLMPKATNGVYALISSDNTIVPGSVKTLIIRSVSQNDTTKKDACVAITIRQ